MTQKKTEEAGLLEIRLKTLFDYGVDLKRRTISITGDIDEEMYHFVDTAVSELAGDNRKAITVRINSEGGSVYDALAIVGRLKSAGVSQIITEGQGCVMSAATLILACGDIRRISEYAWAMHHECSYEIDGRHSDIDDFRKQVDREHGKWAEYMARFSNKSKQFWVKAGVGKDLYLSPEELLKYGVVDSII